MTEEQFRQKQADMPANELIQKARDMVCKLAETYGKSHKMSIPPDVDDTDMLLMEVIDRYEQLLKERYDNFYTPLYDPARKGDTSLGTCR